MKLCDVKLDVTSWQRTWYAVLNTKDSLTVSQWVRDLTEEGIEPHPGPNPSFVSKNVRGISAAKEFGRLLRHAQARFTKDPNLHAIMIQETNIRGKEKIEEYKKVAARAKILMIGGHM